MRRATPPIVISDDISQFGLKHEFFDGKLTLSWGFDQFMCETVRSAIINKFVADGKEETIKINLKNVQEYVPNPEARSFFTGETGGLVLRDAFTSIGNYIALSMRDTEITLETQYSEKTATLGCGDWVRVRGHVVKIIKLEHEILPCCSIVRITAAGFSATLEGEEIVSVPRIEAPKHQEFCSKDIIHDLVVQNDGTAQYRKLQEFIGAQKGLGKIDASNYKAMISKFLAENQTKITIVTKPLKTEHCKKITIDI
jgi:hypothetical protein